VFREERSKYDDDDDLCVEKMMIPGSWVFGGDNSTIIVNH
jgi:hypothetical protein